MKNKERKLKLTAEDYNEKVSLQVKLNDGDDESVTIEEFYYACMQLACGMGYSYKSIKTMFKDE
jgi:hypothetical protein